MKEAIRPLKRNGQDGWATLSNAISTEWNLQRQNMKPCNISRDRLEKLSLDDEDVHLSPLELRALDAYFTKRHGKSLAELPIFERESWLEALAEPPRHASNEPGRVCFILGCRVNRAEQANDLRRWDVRSMACLSQEFGTLRRQVKIEFEDAMLTLMPEQQKSEPWYRHFAGVGPSLLAIGSPRSNPASEVLLSEMLGAGEPFTPPKAGTSQLPFYFVWAKPQLRAKILLPRRSCFALEINDLPPKQSRLAKKIAQREAIGFKVGEEFCEVLTGDHPSSTSYGVIVGQRRRDGRVFVVVAGANGPATYGASVYLPQLKAALPHPEEPNQHGRPVWAVVEVPVLKEERQEGDTRKVNTNDLRIKSGPRIWP